MGDPVLYQHLFLNKWTYFLCDSDTKDLSALYSTLFEGIPTLSLVGNHEIFSSTLLAKTTAPGWK